MHNKCIEIHWHATYRVFLSENDFTRQSAGYDMADCRPPQRRESGGHPCHAKFGVAVFIAVFSIILCFPDLVFPAYPDQGISIKFSNNLNEALARAKVSRKPVVVVIFALWCPYCREMQETTMKAAEVAEVGEAFEWVFIELDRNMTLARQYDVRAIPTFLLFDPDGNQRSRIVGKVGPVQFRGYLLEFLEGLKAGEDEEISEPPVIKADLSNTPLHLTPTGFRGRSICFSHVGYGPLKLQSQSPFQALRLGMIPLTPSTLSRGQKELRGAASWVNIWNVSEGEYFFDYEMLQTILTFDYGVSDTLQIGVGTEVRGRSGGYMDGFIQGFHDLFGIDQSGRDLVPKGEFTFEIDPSGSRPGVALTSDDRGIFSQNILITVQHNVTCGTSRLPAFSYAVTARVEAGNSHDLEGGKGFDIGASVSLSRRFGKFYAYGTLGYSRFGRERFRDIELRDDQLTGLLALEWRFAPWMSVLIQYLVTEGVAEDLGEISKPSHEVTLGWKGEVSKGTVVEVGLIENVITYDNSPDFGIHVGVKHRF
jgi:thiol-disulfide isomerase/thioredoxin